MNSFILFTTLLSSRMLEKADILLDNKYTTFNHLHLDLVNLQTVDLQQLLMEKLPTHQLQPMGLKQVYHVTLATM